MAVTFKQIRDNKNISERDGFGVIIISSLIITGLVVILIRVINLNPYILSVIVILSIWFGRKSTRKLLGDFAKSDDIVGEIKFDHNSITWTKNSSVQKVDIADIASLSLKYNYIQGRQFASRDIIHNGLAQLTILTVSKQSSQIKFLIESEKQLSAFKPIWKEYYKNGIIMKERMGKYDIKTILFGKDNLSFEKIQALKDELNADGFN